MKQRTQDVLYKTIDSYIRTGEAVGSKKLMEQYSFNCSPATLRNELNTLMNQGYLAQLHFSSGRVPTEKGYRSFVNGMVHPCQSSDISIPKEISDMISMHGDVTELLVDVSQVLSVMFRYTGVVMLPSIIDRTLKAIHLVLLDVHRVMIVVLGSMGMTKEFLMDIEGDISQEDLQKISKLMTLHFEGNNINELKTSDLRFVMDTFPHYKSLCQRLKKAVNIHLSEAKEAPVIQNGASTMLTLPEFDNIDYARRVMTLLDDTATLSQLFDLYIQKEATQVVIGEAESGEQLLENSSLVLRPCYREGKSFGTLAFLGPTRMNYGVLIPLVDNIVEMIENSVVEKECVNYG